MIANAETAHAMDTLGDAATEPAKLLVIGGPGLGRAHPLTGPTVIGRGKDATLILDDDEVSRAHARIDCDGTYRIVDLDSRNGTRVNGVPVRSEVLRFGDRIQLGKNMMLLFTHHDAAEEQLLQRQRLESLGRIAAGVAHDFNNVLSAILATQSYLLSADPDTHLGDVDVRECLLEIGAAAQRAAELTPRLLGFARGQSGAHAPLDMAKLCDEVAALAERTFHRHIHIDKQIEPNLLVVGDRVELFQVLLNLCVNARDAMPDGGTLTISARLVVRSVRISIADTGTGMSEAVRQRIFEPFFSTKERNGFGLGLATAKQMIAVHGGQIGVESALGRGSTFHITLPMSRDPLDLFSTATGGSWDRELDARPPSELRVLLIDDDALCRRAYARGLAAAGFEVVAVPDGHAALKEMRSPAPPSVVVLDLDMPELSGEETFRMIRYLDVDVPVIVLSGHRCEARAHALLIAGISSFLPKPCGVEELIQAIRSALVEIECDETSVS